MCSTDRCDSQQKVCLKLSMDGSLTVMYTLRKQPKPSGGWQYTGPTHHPSNQVVSPTQTTCAAAQTTRQLPGAHLHRAGDLQGSRHE